MNTKTDKEGNAAFTPSEDYLKQVDDALVKLFEGSVRARLDPKKDIQTRSWWNKNQLLYAQQITPVRTRKIFGFFPLSTAYFDPVIFMTRQTFEQSVVSTRTYDYCHGLDMPLQVVDQIFKLKKYLSDPINPFTVIKEDLHEEFRRQMHGPSKEDCDDFLQDLQSFNVKNEMFVSRPLPETELQKHSEQEST